MKTESTGTMEPRALRIRRSLAYGCTLSGLALFVWWHFEVEPRKLWTYHVPELFSPNGFSSYTYRAMTASFLAMNATIPLAPFLLPVITRSRLTQWFLGVLSGVSCLPFILYATQMHEMGHLLLVILAPISTSLGIFLAKPRPRVSDLGN